MLKSIGLMMIAVCGMAQDGSISGQRIRDFTKALSSDSMEGRGVGSKGGDLATEYIANQLSLAGAKPAGQDGTWYQKVPLVGVETVAGSALAASGGGKTVEFKLGDEFVGTNMLQQTDARFEGEAVFVGHGIAAPELGWDDFKGVDVTGKIVVLFTNEPNSADPKFFDGKALTYYGRWTYKYEEALRRGAKGCIIIHTTPTASYGWEVVRSSWGGESPYVKVREGEKALAIAGWVSREAGEKLLGLTGHSVDEMLKASDRKDFRPVPLGIQVRGRMLSKVREIESRNVVGKIEGSDAKLKDEYVIYSAHWDHLGVGAAVNGDSIYNGAIDNATGCAVLIELARAWAALPVKPRRSVLFLAVTAEEGGLKGSEYYAQHPLVPLAKSAINLNYDALFPWGRAKDVVLTGAERTTVYPMAQQIAKRLGLAVSGDVAPEAGHYFRSDHFSLAHAGVPAFSIDHATEFAGKPAGWGKQAYEDYNEKRYHQPSDQFEESWDFTALAQAGEFGFLLGRDVANSEKLPDWRPGAGFKR